MASGWPDPVGLTRRENEPPPCLQAPTVSDPPRRRRRTTASNLYWIRFPPISGSDLHRRRRRTGTIKTPVFKAPRLYSRLRELARVHSMLVRDVVPVQARLKVMYRARGIATPGKSVYSPSGRDQWLNRLPVSSRWATEKLHEEYDLLLELKREAERELVLKPA